MTGEHKRCRCGLLLAQHVKARCHLRLRRILLRQRELLHWLRRLIWSAIRRRLGRKLLLLKQRLLCNGKLSLLLHGAGLLHFLRRHSAVHALLHLRIIVLTHTQRRKQDKRKYMTAT